MMVGLILRGEIRTTIITRERNVIFFLSFSADKCHFSIESTIPFKKIELCVDIGDCLKFQ